LEEHSVYTRKVIGSSPIPPIIDSERVICYFEAIRNKEKSKNSTKTQHRRAAEVGRMILIYFVHVILLRAAVSMPIPSVSKLSS
jgi:hypothetical protein